MPVFKIKQNGEWVDIAGGGINKLENVAYIGESDIEDATAILFVDEAMTIPTFPRTKVKAISDDNGVGLDAILKGLATKEYVNEILGVIENGSY